MRVTTGEEGRPLKGHQRVRRRPEYHASGMNAFTIRVQPTTVEISPGSYRHCDGERAASCANGLNCVSATPFRCSYQSPRCYAKLRGRMCYYEMLCCSPVASLYTVHV